MKRALISLAALAALVSFEACVLPGQGENQSCIYTPDCQVHLVCLHSVDGGAQANADGGVDGGGAGVCKFECTTTADCPNNETCQGYEYNLHCDSPAPDGG